LSVISVFKHKLEKVRETLAGHLKSAGGPHAANGPQVGQHCITGYIGTSNLLVLLHPESIII